MREKIQQLGGYLAGMIMPAISAFIAWGLLTSFVIPTGWTPNEDLAAMVGPIIVYLLPVLIGFNAGYLVHGRRGGVVGATVTMGVVVGASIPMFLGAMIVGPASAWVVKKLDETGTYLIKTYGFDPKDHALYQEQTIERFKNPHIIDPVTRIARNPKRKLSSQDRIIFPANELVKLGIHPAALVELIVYGLRYNEPSDEEAMEIQSMLSHGDSNAIHVITGLEETSSLHQAILRKYRDTISSR